MLVAGASVQAQLSASVGIETDHRFRGVSLSDGRPDAYASVAYDHDSGAFAGTSVTRVEFVRGRPVAQWLGYAGYAARLPQDLAAEFGLIGATFSGNTRYDYSEAFVGVSGERWALRAYYAPDYFGFDQTTAYVELDANAPLHPRLRLFAHLGALTLLRGAPADGHGRTRYDARLALGWSVQPGWDLQLAWVSATQGGPYVVEYGNRRSTGVLSAIASF